MVVFTALGKGEIKVFLYTHCRFLIKKRYNFLLYPKSCNQDYFLGSKFQEW